MDKQPSQFVLHSHAVSHFGPTASTVDATTEWEWPSSWRRRRGGEASAAIGSDDHPSTTVLSTTSGLYSSNPTAFVNPEQPLVGEMEVKDDDITAQEEKVKEARVRLAAAIKALG